MKRNGTRLLALLLAAMMMLTACGQDKPASDANSGTPAPGTDTNTPAEPEETKAEPVKDWYTYKLSTAELTTFLVFHSEGASELEVLQPLSTPLLEQDTHGNLLPAAAKEWGTEDSGLNWTFKLRDDIVWVDVNGNEKAKTTAQDWITALEWTLNYYKNDSYNTSMPKMMIQGAQEYCDYTQNMDEEEALALTVENGPFLEMVGIEAPDDYTLVYHCTKECPYFETLCPNATLRPMSQAMIDELGVDGVQNMDNTTMWYNGAYIMTEFVQNNSKVLTPNPLYWDKDCTRFDSIHYAMVSDALAAQSLFMNGELDACTLSESNLKTIYDNPNSEWYPYLVESRPDVYSYQIHWNFFKNLDDGETPDDNWNNAISNLAFRKSFYYGLDFTNYWSRYNFINPGSCENVAYTMKEMMYYPDGTDYVSKVQELVGYPDGTGRYDAEKGQSYKEQAMQELAGKVEFPVEIDYFISASNQEALDTATVLKETFESMGTDYVVFNIKTYVSSSLQEVTIPRRHSLSISGWGADYRDPENFLGQEIRGDESALYKRANGCNFITDEGMIEVFDTFTEKYRAAAAICDDTTKRYDALAEAEAYMIDNVITLPISYRVSWLLTKGNDYANERGFKNWETSAEPYKTEQYEQFKTEFYAK